MDEGYIKFNAVWKKMPPPAPEELADLPSWRDVAHRKGLIGAYPNGIGYGNISRRLGEGGTFVITGSATGHLPALLPDHFTKVTGFDPEANKVYCEGPIVASSESMSHAAVYRACPPVNGVIHAHHAALWAYLLDKVPSTGQAATYGSPAMALAILGLFETTDVAEQKIFVMEGHPEGIFTFGENLQEALRVLDLWLEKLLN